jgi:carboxyl-terminal processing protease
MYYITDFLNPTAQPFVKFSNPNLSYPGTFSYTKAMRCGRKNPDYYKGKVVLLVNEYAQSHSEFTLMALQTAPNVVCIGSPSAGADGNVSTIIFPGGYKTMMTGIGVFYPDGRETQRVGIVPDITIRPTIEGVKMRKDEVLDRAIRFILDKETVPKK